MEWAAGRLSRLPAAAGRAGYRVTRALLTSARPQLFVHQYILGAAENEMGAFADFWAQLLQTYHGLHLFAVVALDAGYGSRHNATLIDTAGYGYVLGLKANQPELLRQAQRLLDPLAATPAPEARVLERHHGQWGGAIGGAPRSVPAG